MLTNKKKNHLLCSSSHAYPPISVNITAALFGALEQRFSTACQDHLGTLEKYVCRTLYSEVIQEAWDRAWPEYFGKGRPPVQVIVMSALD